MTKILGSALGHSQFSATMDVIGEVTQSPNGNPVLRVGHGQPDGTYIQTGHIVLTPDERDQLIAQLIALNQFNQAHHQTSAALKGLTAWQEAHPGTGDYRVTDAIRALTAARRALQHLRDGTHGPHWHKAKERLRERLADESGEPGTQEKATDADQPAPADMLPPATTGTHGPSPTH